MRVKRPLLVAAVLVLVLGAGLYVWARSVLAGPAVKNAVAAEMSRALGEPVAIGDLSVQVFPRISINAADVTIGAPARISVKSLHIGTALGALFSRRIEHADLRLDGARIALPLPAFRSAGGAAPPSSASSGSASPIEIVSIDEIVLDEVALVAGGRTLTGDIEIVPHGTNAFTVRRVALGAGATSLTLTGEVLDAAAGNANLAMQAGTIDAVELMAFLNDFTAAALPAPVAGSAAARPSPAAMHVSVVMSADELTFGALALKDVGGTALITGDRVAIDQAKFRIFDGVANGIVTLALDAASSFDLSATLTGVDVASAMAFAGSPGAMTGRAGGTMQIRGRGVTAADVIRSAAGTVRLDATDGAVRGLGLVKAIVLAGSMRASSQAQVSSVAADEPFTRLGMTLDIAGGNAHTDDLKFESDSLRLDAAGDLKLDGTRVDLAGTVQLSDALTKSAGRDLVRYTQQDGRVTLPVGVTGSLDAPQVRVDLADLAKRALTNKAKEEARKRLLKGLGKIIK